MGISEKTYEGYRDSIMDYKNKIDLKLNKFELVKEANLAIEKAQSDFKLSRNKEIIITKYETFKHYKERINRRGHYNTLEETIKAVTEKPYEYKRVVTSSARAQNKISAKVIMPGRER